MSYRSTSSRYGVNGYRSQPVSNRTSLYSTSDYTSSVLTGDISDFDRQFKRLMERTEKFTNRVEKLQSTATNLRKGFRDIDRTVTGRSARPERDVSTFNYLINPDQESTEEQWKRYLDLGILIEKAVEFLRQQSRYPKPVFEYSPESRSPYSYNISPDTILVSNPHSPPDREAKKIRDLGCEINVKHLDTNRTESSLTTGLQNSSSTTDKSKFKRFSRHNNNITKLTEIEESAQESSKKAHIKTHANKKPQQHTYETKERSSSFTSSKLFSSSSKKHKERPADEYSTKLSDKKENLPTTSTSNTSALETVQSSSNKSPLEANNQSNTGSLETIETPKRRFRTAKDRSAASKARPSTIYNDNSSPVTTKSLDSSTKNNKTSSVEVTEAPKQTNTEKSSVKSSKRNSFLDDSFSRGNTSSRSSFHEYIPGHRMPLKERLRLKEQMQQKPESPTPELDSVVKPHSSLTLRASKIIRAKYHGGHDVDVSNNDTEKQPQPVSKTPSFKSRFLRKFRGSDKDVEKEKEKEKEKDCDKKRRDNTRSPQPDALDLLSPNKGFVNPSFDDLQNSDNEAVSSSAVKMEQKSESTKPTDSQSFTNDKTDFATTEQQELAHLQTDATKTDDSLKINIQSSPEVSRRNNDVVKRRKKTMGRQNKDGDDVELVGNLNRKSVLIYEDEILPTKTRKEKMILQFRSPKRSKEEVEEEDVTIVTKRVSNVIPDDLFDALKEPEVSDEVQRDVISQKKDVVIDESIFDRIYQITQEEETAVLKGTTNLRSERLTSKFSVDKTKTNPQKDSVSNHSVRRLSSKSSSEDANLDLHTQKADSTDVKATSSTHRRPGRLSSKSSFKDVLQETNAKEAIVDNSVILALDTADTNDSLTTNEYTNKVPHDQRPDAIQKDSSEDNDGSHEAKKEPHSDVSDGMSTVHTTITLDENIPKDVISNAHNHHVSAQEIPVSALASTSIKKQSTNHSSNTNVAKKTKEDLRARYSRSKSLNGYLQSSKDNSPQYKLSSSKSVDIPSKSTAAKTNNLPKQPVIELQTQRSKGYKPILDPRTEALNVFAKYSKHTEDEISGITSPSSNANQLPNDLKPSIDTNISPQHANLSSIPQDVSQRIVNRNNKPDIVDKDDNTITSSNQTDARQCIADAVPSSITEILPTHCEENTANSSTNFQTTTPISQATLLNEQKAAMAIIDESQVTDRSITYNQPTPNYVDQSKYELVEVEQEHEVLEQQSPINQEPPFNQTTPCTLRVVQENADMISKSTDQATSLSSAPSPDGRRSTSPSKKRLSYLEKRQQHMALLDTNSSVELSVNLMSLLEATKSDDSLDSIRVAKGTGTIAETTILHVETTETVAETTVKIETTEVDVEALEMCVATTESVVETTPTFIERMESHADTAVPNIGFSAEVPTSQIEELRCNSATRGRSDQQLVTEINLQKERSSNSTEKSSEAKPFTGDASTKSNISQEPSTVNTKSHSSNSKTNDVFILQNDATVEQDVFSSTSCDVSNIEATHKKRIIERGQSNSQSNYSSSGRSAISSGKNSDDDEARKQSGSRLKILEKQMSIKEYRLKKKQSHTSEGSISSDFEESFASAVSSLGDTSDNNNGNTDVARHKRYSHNRKDTSKTHDFFSSSSESECPVSNRNTTNTSTENGIAEEKIHTASSSSNDGNENNQCNNAIPKTTDVSAGTFDPRLQSYSDGPEIAVERRKKYSKRSAFRSVDHF